MLAVTLFGVGGAAPSRAQSILGAGGAEGAPAKAVPPAAAEALRNALLTLETIKASGLEPWWKANAMALATRSLGRTGKLEPARVMAREAIATMENPAKTQPPPALSRGPVFAILAQAFVDLQDASTAAGMVNLANQEMAKIADAPTRANIMPYLALTAIDLGQAGPAREMIQAGQRAAAETPAGRERVSSLATIATAQARLGETDAAAASIRAARDLVSQIPNVADRALAAANVARAEAANRNGPAGRSLARQAANDYDASTRLPERSMVQSVRTLGAIALAQAESGDKVAARSTLVAMRHTVEPIQNAYERFVGLTLLTDAVVQVER